MEATIPATRPIGAGGGRLAGFLAGSAALGSLIIALLVVLADLDDEPEDGFDVDDGPDA
jgi:hypothetical protein